MNFLQAMVLGIVQGLTEFLPISSTAHLRIVPALFGWTFDYNPAHPHDPGAAFTAVPPNTGCGKSFTAVPSRIVRM